MTELEDGKGTGSEALPEVEASTAALRLLSALASGLSVRGSLRERALAALAALSAAQRVLPFVELHVREGDDDVYRRVARDPLATGPDWPVAHVARARRAMCVEEDAGASAWLLPVAPPGELTVRAVLVAGFSAQQRHDPDHRLFLDLLVSELGRVLAGAGCAEAQTQDGLLHTLFMTSPVAICVVSGPEHRYILANRSYIEMVSKPNLLGRTITEVFPEIVGTPLLDVFDTVYATGEPYVAPEFVTALDRDGDGIAEECFFTFNLVATRDRFDAVSGWTCTAADITAQVRARHAAERANRAKDEFMAVLGHELRNPLAPITTALFLMEKRGDDRTLSERATIQRQVDHLVRLVDDLLDVSRVTGGKLRLQKQAIPLHEVVEQAVEMSSPLVLERDHTLTVHVPNEGLVVFGDRARLAQAVSNLLINAAKYTQPQGFVSVDARKADDHVLLTVRDSGSGIRAEMLPRVFEMFEQERQALDRSLGGLGIGLPIVRGLVELHEGTVSAHSDGVGLGSSFTIRLPLARPSQLTLVEPAVVPRPPRPPSIRPPRHERILVVDDNKDAALTLAAVLHDMGKEVKVAFDAHEALDIAPSFLPTLALLDIGLPEMDGYALAERLRPALRPQRVRLVAVTGYGQPSDIDRAFAAGFDAHVVKPLRPETVESILADLDAERELKRQ